MNMTRPRPRGGCGHTRGYGLTRCPTKEPTCTHTRRHTNHTHGTAHPRDLQGWTGCSRKPPGALGVWGEHEACPEATLPGVGPHPGGVWGGKVARPPGEAVVAGALARAHALERHPGSSGGVPCGQNTDTGLQTVAQAPLVGRAAPPAWLHHQSQQGWVPAVKAPSPPTCPR